MRSGNLAAVVLGALATACGGDGIQVEIHTSLAPATSVELFITASKCDGCADGIGPAGENALLTPAEVYERDHPDVYTATVDDDGVARFWVRGGPGGDKVKAIAVGYDAQGVENAVAGLAIDTTRGPAIYEIELAPARPRPSRTDEPGTYVQVWTNGEDRCVLVEQDGGVESTYVAIVPAEDHDCDGVVGDLECSAYVHKFSSPPVTDLASGSCFATVVGGDACRVGGGCQDGAQRCQPGGICVPDSFCACDYADPTCLQGQAHETASAYVACEVPTGDAGAPCPTPMDEVVIGRPVNATTATCTDVAFLGLPAFGEPSTLTLADIQDGSALQFPSGTKLSLTRLEANCSLSLRHVGIPENFADGTNEAGLVALTLGSGRTVVVPIRIRLTAGGCDAPGTCTLHEVDASGALARLFACSL